MPSSNDLPLNTVYLTNGESVQIRSQLTEDENHVFLWMKTGMTYTFPKANVLYWGSCP